MNQNFRPEANSDREGADSSSNINKDNFPQALPGIAPQSNSPEETLESGDWSLKTTPKDSPPQQLKTNFSARITATLVGALVMLPVLAMGTATYYFGSQAINKQTILLKRTNIPELAKAELTEEKQLLAMLLIGTGSTALLAGGIAALWFKRTSAARQKFCPTKSRLHAACSRGVL